MHITMKTDMFVIVEKLIKSAILLMSYVRNTL